MSIDRMAGRHERHVGAEPLERRGGGMSPVRGAALTLEHECPH